VLEMELPNPLTHEDKLGYGTEGAFFSDSLWGSSQGLMDRLPLFSVSTLIIILLFCKKWYSNSKIG
jgi:hypothetical protein